MMSEELFHILNSSLLKTCFILSHATPWIQPTMCGVSFFVHIIR